MKNLNPLCVIMACLSAGLGYLITGTAKGAIIGLCWSLGATLAATAHAAFFVLYVLSFVVWCCFNV